MKTGAPLCARGRVRALRGLPLAPSERGLRGPFQPLGSLAAGAGEAAAAGRALGGRENLGMRDLRAAARC